MINKIGKSTNGTCVYLRSFDIQSVCLLLLLWSLSGLSPHVYFSSFSHLRPHSQYQSIALHSKHAPYSNGIHPTSSSLFPNFIPNAYTWTERFVKLREHNRNLCWNVFYFIYLKKKHQWTVTTVISQVTIYEPDMNNCGIYLILRCSLDTSKDTYSESDTFQPIQYLPIWRPFYA